MKRFIGVLVSVSLMFVPISCTQTRPVPASSDSLTTAAATSPDTITSSKAYLPSVLNPSQGGNMLYPTYHTLPKEIREKFYLPKKIGIINQNGDAVASPQYVEFVYYKDPAGRIQYGIATGNGKCVVYHLDGTEYMQFEAETVTAYNGFPYLLVGLDTFCGGPGSEPDNSYTVYDLRTGKKALDKNYNVISFVDSHTALLQNYGEVKDNPYGFEYINSYLYDFNAKPSKLVKMEGYIHIFCRPPFADTVTRIPATDVDTSFIDADDSTVKYGYLDRDGHWVKKSEEDDGVKPPENKPEDTAPYVCEGLDNKLSFEDRYFWVTEDAFEGYQDKNGTWLYRENSSFHFLED